jgi:hypothetical protein
MITGEMPLAQWAVSFSKCGRRVSGVIGFDGDELLSDRCRSVSGTILTLDSPSSKRMPETETG